MIVFFINGNPQKWFWFFIFFASIIQNIVLLKKNKEVY
ncbi:histidine kinase [Bacillus cereus]|nr:histidine kinase [Bacillus cereus]